MRESLPFISGPGAIFSAYLLLYLYIHDNSSVNNNNSNIFAGIALFAVIISPIYNFIFHTLWSVFFQSYQGFGAQKKYLAKYSKIEIAKSYDIALYSTKKGNFGSAIDYTRRRVAGYVHNLQMRYAIIISVVIYHGVLFYNIHNLNYGRSDFFVLVVSMVIIVLNHKLTSETIDPELTSFEEWIINHNNQDELPIKRRG